MFSCVQYKTMEQWNVYFGLETLYKGPVYVLHNKILLIN